MKRILLLLVLCLNISMVLGQEYKNWDKYDIEGFYTIAKSKAEAKISKNVLREGADYYIPTEMMTKYSQAESVKRSLPSCTN